MLIAVYRYTKFLVGSSDSANIEKHTPRSCKQIQFMLPPTTSHVILSTFNSLGRSTGSFPLEGKKILLIIFSPQHSAVPISQVSYKKDETSTAIKTMTLLH